jgi:hypothetical protein
MQIEGGPSHIGGTIENAAAINFNDMQSIANVDENGISRTIHQRRIETVLFLQTGVDD